MSDVATQPRLPSDDPAAPLGASLVPPHEWVTTIPEWLFGAAAHDVHVELDPEHEDFTRAAGLYYSHDSCYMNDTSECWLPPASPSGNEPFYSGHADYGGDVGRVLTGTIPIFGGHTDTTLSYDEAMQARNDRPEDQRLVGSLFDLILPYDPEHLAETVDDPERSLALGLARQAGVFLGSATAEMTVGEAVTVNRSGLSGEWWPRRNFVSTTGSLISLGLDALGPVLVTRAAIASNRQGRASAAGSHLPLAASYTRTASGPVIGPRKIYGATMAAVTTNASPKWAGTSVAAAAPVIDTSTAPAAGGAPRVACSGGCGGTATAETVEATCGPCSGADPGTDDEATTDDVMISEPDAVLARMEGALAQLTAPTLVPLDDGPAGRTLTRTAALSGVSWQNRKDFLRTAAQAVFPQIIADGLGLDVDEDVYGVYISDFDDTEVIVNVDVSDPSWRETFWQVSYTVSADGSVEFGDTAAEQVPTRSYEPTGTDLAVA